MSVVGTVFDHGSGEDVVLTGELHLLTSVSDGLMDWHLNAGHVAGHLDNAPPNQDLVR